MSQLYSKIFLDRIIAQGKPSHAYLFFGPPSSEKELKTKAFSKGLLCKKKQLEGCGECASCRKFDSGNHPDFREIGADEDKIKISEIRAVKDETRFAPFESDWKIYLISHAERLTEEAAQSMLKILEEPPLYVVFILTASHPASVLPTLASRCQRVPFLFKTPSELCEVLSQEEGLPPDMASLLSHLDVAVSEAKAWSVLVTEATPVLFSETKNPLDLFENGLALEDFKDEGENLLCLLFAFYRDVAVLKAGWDDGVVFPAYKTRAKTLSKALSWGVLWEKSRAILEADDHLRHSGNFRLVMENLLWKLRS